MAKLMTRSHFILQVKDYLNTFINERDGHKIPKFHFNYLIHIYNIKAIWLSFALSKNGGKVV